jgi:hypothetical protein
MARKATIFISHSSKDDSYAGAVRDALEAALIEAGFDVLLDRTRLDPGDEWRAKLHRWLGTCDGAALLFGPAALRSDWVRKEATILTWRRAFQGDIRVVPAVFGGVGKSELDEYGLGPAHLDEIQIASLTPEQEALPSESERAEALAQAIAAGFAGLPPRTGDTPMDRWVAQVVGLIQENEYLAETAEKLLHVEDAPAGEGPVQEVMSGGRTLAAQRVAQLILDSDAETIAQAYYELDRGDIRDRTRLVSLITPSWVPTASARAIAAAVGRPAPTRLVALRCREPLTPEHVAKKATCCDTRHRFVPILSERSTTEDPVRELTSRYRRELLAKLGVADARSARERAGSTDPVVRGQELLENRGARLFVILSADQTGWAVGRRLRTEQGFDRPVYVYAGATIDEAVQVEGVEVVQPELSEDEELDGSLVAGQLLDAVGA